MPRSFGSFLLDYCQQLTGQNTTSLKKLFRAANEGNPRAFEPLLLLAICNGRTGFLLRQAHGTAWHGRYEAFLSEMRSSKVDLCEHLRSLPDGNRYKRPLLAWEAEALRKEQDVDMMKNLIRSMLNLIDEKGIDRAEACRIAGVNKGNFYAFLKGDLGKMKRETAVNAYKAIANA